MILAATTAIGIAVIVAIQIWPERALSAAGLAQKQTASAPVAAEPSAVLRKANASFTRGQYGEAIAAYKQYEALAANDVQKANALAAIGWTHRAQNDLAAAGQSIIDAAKLDADQLQKALTAALNRGDVAFAKELHERAAATPGLHADAKFMAWAGTSIAAAAATPAASRASVATPSGPQTNRAARKHVAASSNTYFPPGPEDTPPPPLP